MMVSLLCTKYHTASASVLSLPAGPVSVQEAAAGGSPPLVRALPLEEEHECCLLPSTRGGVFHGCQQRDGNSPHGLVASRA